MGKLNLKQIPLKAGLIKGVNIAYNGGGEERYDPQEWVGYDGVEFVGQGYEKTIIQAPNSDASIMIGRGTALIPTKIVRFSGVTVKPALSKAIFCGVDTANMADYRIGLGFQFYDSLLDARERQGRWGAFFNQTDVKMRRSFLFGEGLTEHLIYMHGWGKDGCSIAGCILEGAWAEIIKGTNRPQGRYYINPTVRSRAKHAYLDGYHPAGTPDMRPTVHIEDNIIRRWGLGGYGGGGVVMQGTSANIRIRSNFITAENNIAKGGPIFIDDSGNEYFTRKGSTNEWVAGEEGPANGHVHISENVMTAAPGSSNYTPMIRVGSLKINNNSPIVESFSMFANAIYGEKRFITLQQTPNCNITANNIDPIPDYARGLGIDTSHEAFIHVNGHKLTPVSAGFAGNAK